METSKEQPAQQPADRFDPLAGWEAAARWNRATFAWMTRGWQQWVALVTTVPPQFIAPPRRGAPASRVSAEPRALAKGEPKRVATKKAAAKGRKRS